MCNTRVYLCNTPTDGGIVGMPHKNDCSIAHGTKGCNIINFKVYYNAMKRKKIHRKG